MNKAGIQLQTLSPAAVDLVRATWPATLKLLHGARDLVLAREWRQHRPDGVLILRYVTDDTAPLSELPRLTAEAIRLFDGFQRLGGTVILEVPINERFQTTPEDFAALATASVPAARTILAAGFTPGVLITSEGNPPGDADGVAFFLQPVVRAALAEFRAMGAIWCPHGYSHPPAASDDPYHATRPACILAALPEDARLNYAYGEDGCDGGTDQPDRKPGRGWIDYFPGDDGTRYAAWYDRKRAADAADPLCIGSATFLVGADPAGRPNFASFDVADAPGFRRVFTEHVDGPPIRWLSKETTHDRRDPGQVPGPDPDAAAGAAGGVRPPAGGAGDTGEPGTQGGGVHAGLPQEGRMNPWSGKGAIVRSNAVASWSEVIAMAHALGLDYLDLQVGNGAGSWVGSHVTRELVDRLKGEGFRVTGWLYDYDDLAGPRYYPKDGVPEEEAANVVGIVQTLGLDGFTSDLEDEPEGHGDLVSIFLAAVRAGLPGVPLAAFTWADLHGHERYPMDVISSAVDCLRPMSYAPVWRAPRMIASLWPYMVGRDWAPAWGVTEATRPELVEDFATADHAGDNRPDMRAPIGESYWEATALIARQAELGAILKARFSLPAVTPAPAAPPSNAPVAVPAEVTAALDALWAAAGADMGKQKAIIAVKVAWGLQAA